MNLSKLSHLTLYSAQCVGCSRHLAEMHLIHVAGGRWKKRKLDNFSSSFSSQEILNGSVEASYAGKHWYKIIIFVCTYSCIVSKICMWRPFSVSSTSSDDPYNSNLDKLQSRRFTILLNVLFSTIFQKSLKIYVFNALLKDEIKSKIFAIL